MAVIKTGGVDVGIIVAVGGAITSALQAVLRSETNRRMNILDKVSFMGLLYPRNTLRSVLKIDKRNLLAIILIARNCNKDY